MAIKKVRIRPEGGNNYADVLHPETSADVVIESEDKMFVSSAEKTNWNNKADKTYVDTELNKRYLKEQVFTKEEVLQKIQDVIGAAPEALDTLQEIAEALNNDANFAGTITNELSKKVDKIAGKQLSTEDYTTAEKNKLAGIEEGANKYIHPSTHPASMIVETSSRRFVSDSEKATWNNKQDALGYTPVNKAGDTMTGDLKVNGSVVAGTEYIVGYNGTTESLQRFKFKYNASNGYLELWRYSDDTGWTLCATFPNRNNGDGGLTIEGEQVAYKSDIPVKLSQLTKDINFDERYYTESEVDNKLNSKVDKVDGKGLSTEDYTTAEKTKLANIEAGANKYTHPSTHPASMITETSSRRFVSDSEKAKWDAKWDYNEEQIKQVKVNNAVNADTVNGKTVESNVPANAKFTDTTYSEISTSEIDAGTSSTLRTITGRRVKYILDKVSSMILTAISNLTKADVGLGNVDNVKQASKTEFDAHVNNKSNPHSVTKSQVGLGNVQDYGIATQAIAEAGTSNSYYMTPLRVKQSIEKNALTNILNLETDFNNHKTDTNVHGLRDDVVIIGKDANAMVGSGMANVAVGMSTFAFAASTAIGAGANAEDMATQAIGSFAQALNNSEGVLGIEQTSWKVPGNFTVSGTKNFEIPHPKPEKSATHVIRHGAVESPTPGDTLYRWKIQATKDNDLVTIDLPDYFVWLNTNVQIFVTPQGHFGNGYGILNRETEQLEIHCQYEGEYNVLVIGTRNDDHPSVREWSIKGVEREVGESWTGETYAFSVDEILEVEEIKEV